MELILKPTSACNFACTFCAASQLSLQTLKSVPDNLKKVLDVLKPQSLIITGGEPLLCPVSFYEELLQLGSWSLAFTTNLKAFYERPDIWTDLFKDKRVGVCTSFQFGSGRRWSREEPYSEEQFVNVMQLFKEKVGYMPMFIAVLSTENEAEALKHLVLARKLGTKCKLNGVLPIGKSTEFFPRWKLVKVWLDALDAGYGDALDYYVPACHGGCGFNTNLLCQTTIRAYAIAADGRLLYAQCEEDLNSRQESMSIDQCQPAPVQTLLKPEEMISRKCLFCKLCRLCNGCKHARKAAKLDPFHCSEMKKLEQRIIDAGWCL